MILDQLDVNTVGDPGVLDSPSDGMEAREGKVARAIEQKTAKIPSDAYLWAAGGAIAASVVMQLLPQKRGLFGRTSRMSHLSLFIGQWVPTFLLLGVYNKIVKEFGRSDAEA